MSARNTLIVITLTLAAGAALRVGFLGRPTLTDAEALTLATASQPKSTLIEIFRNRGDRFLPTPLAFPLAARRYSNFGSSEFAARLPGAILGVVSLVLMFLAAREIAGTNTAVLTLAFLALSPHLILLNRTYSHHSLAFFLIAASLWTCMRTVRAERPLPWCIHFAAAFTLCVVFLPQALCLIIPFNMIFTIFGSRDRRVRIVWGALNAIPLCVGFYFLMRWIPALLETPRSTFVFSQFIDSRFVPVPQFLIFQVIELYARVFYGAAGFFMRDNVHLTWWHIVAFALVPVVYHAAFFYGFKLAPGAEKQRAAAFLLLIFSAPVCASLIVIGVPAAEALLPVLPAFTLVLAAGAVRCASLKFRVAFAVTMLFVAAGSVPEVYRAERERIPWRDVTRYLEQKASPADAVVVLDGWQAGPLVYYASPRLEKRIHAFFPDFATRIVADHFLQEDIVRRLRPVFDTSPPFTIRDFFPRHDAVWILYTEKFPDKNNRISTSTYWLHENAVVKEKKTFGGRLTAERLVPGAAAPQQE